MTIAARRMNRVKASSPAVISAKASRLRWDRSRHVPRPPAGCTLRRGLLAAALVAWLPGEGTTQTGGVFRAAQPAATAAAAPGSPVASAPRALRRRLVAIDLAQLVPRTDALAPGVAAGTAATPRGVLTLNLFDDAVFTGLVEQVAPTFSGGRALSGRLAGVELGTMTLVVNGAVVTGTVRTPEATYRIRPAGNGLHAVSEVDLSRLPPLGEPIPRQRRDDRRSFELRRPAPPR